MESLPSSKLGTKEHWDEVYEREVKNFDEIGDEGEVWFGEDSAEEMVDWALEHFPPLEDGSGPLVLDVGCGNGHLLHIMCQATPPYSTSSLTGIDYSPSSISLSRSISQSKGLDGINFEVFDILKEAPEGLTTKGEKDGWELILDKGTYDAISLSDEVLEGEGGKKAFEVYPDKVRGLLRRGQGEGEGGVFCITSCNWTEEELRKAFSEESGFRFHSKIQRPTFTFGGQKGSTITTVAFQRVR